MNKYCILSFLICIYNAQAMEQPEEGTYPKIIKDQLDGFRQASQGNDSYCVLLPEHIRDQVEQYISDLFFLKSWLSKNIEQNLNISPDYIEKIMYSKDWNLVAIFYSNLNSPRIFNIKTKQKLKDKRLKNGVNYYGVYYEAFFSHKRFYKFTTKGNVQKYLNNEKLARDMINGFKTALIEGEETVLDKMIRGEEQVNKDVDTIFAKFTKEHLIEKLLNINQELDSIKQNEWDVIMHVYTHRNENKLIELDKEQKETYTRLPECFQRAMEKFIHIDEK